MLAVDRAPLGDALVALDLRRRALAGEGAELRAVASERGDAVGLDDHAIGQ